MFESAEQEVDYKAFHKAIEEMECLPPCSNFPDAFFPDYQQAGYGELLRSAKALCDDCPIKNLCLAYAIKWDTDGVYGGVTPHERKIFVRNSKPLA